MQDAHAIAAMATSQRESSVAVFPGSRDGRPGLPVPNKPQGFCGRKAALNMNSELRSCVKAEVAVLISLRVSVDVKHY